MNNKLDTLFDSYDGNLLNYFCDLTPEESKQFNKQQRLINNKPWRTLNNY